MHITDGLQWVMHDSRWLVTVDRAVGSETCRLQKGKSNFDA